MGRGRRTDRPRPTFCNFGMEIAMTAASTSRAGGTPRSCTPTSRIPRSSSRRCSPWRPQRRRMSSSRVGSVGTRVAEAHPCGLFYSLMSRVARVPSQGQAGDFRPMSRRVVETIRAMDERRRFLRGWSCGSGSSRSRSTTGAPAGRAGGSVVPGSVPARVRSDCLLLGRPVEARHVRRDADRARQRDRRVHDPDPDGDGALTASLEV